MEPVDEDDDESSPLIPKSEKLAPDGAIGSTPKVSGSVEKNIHLGSEKSRRHLNPKHLARQRSTTVPSSFPTLQTRIVAPTGRHKPVPKRPQSPRQPTSSKPLSTPRPPTTPRQPKTPRQSATPLENDKHGSSSKRGGGYGAVQKIVQAATPRDTNSPSCDSASGEELPTDGASSSESSDTSESSTEGTFSIRGLSGPQKFLLLNVLLSDFLTSCCLSLLAPFFPQEAHNKNISDSISGWIFGVYSLTQFVFAPICGKLLPTIGGRFMYLSGGFWSGACTILFGFLQYVPVDNDGGTAFIALCFSLRIVLAIGCAALQTAGYAFSFNEFPNSVATVFGIMEVFVGLGFMAGPALGGLLYEVGGFYLPFVVVGGLILASVPINYCFIPELEEVDEGEGEGSVMNLLKMPSIVVMNIVVVVGSVIWSILDPTLAPRLNEFSLSPSIVGLIFLLMSAFYALTAPLWGRMADKMKDNKLLLIPGFIFSAISLLLLGPSPIFGLGSDYNQLWLNVVSLCLLGISCSLAIIPSFDVFLDLAETVGFEENVNTYGVVAGLWSSMNALGDFIGPSIGGVLLTSVGFQLCMTYTALACAVVVVLLVMMEIAERCGKKSKSLSNDLENNVQTKQTEDELDRESSVRKEVEYYATNPYITTHSEMA
ncbi:MFS-type transporter SLC18B1-like [Liolophura sinensis]|uniref:MFS-type transporter SLC18B1-like n=1 Tax=Liolophura sinensis TaxID=3198878 RepID=UPI0031597DA2